MTLTVSSTSKPSTHKDPEASKRRRALRRLGCSDEPCDVPGCKARKLIGLDCCYMHSLNDSHGQTPYRIPNDGVIDWLAIDITVEGSRDVRLTNTERNIAIAKMLKKGMTYYEIGERLNTSHAALVDSPSRVREVAYILAALDG